jgi:hypothetical protein
MKRPKDDVPEGWGMSLPSKAGEAKMTQSSRYFSDLKGIKCQ